jgi:hypothetical protein
MPKTTNGFEVSNITPIPVKDEIHMTLKIDVEMPLTIELFDINGRNVSTIYDQRKFEPGIFEIKIPIDKLNTNVYIMKVINGNNFNIRIFSVIK